MTRPLIPGSNSGWRPQSFGQRLAGESKWRQYRSFSGLWVINPARLPAKAISGHPQTAAAKRLLVWSCAPDHPLCRSARWVDRHFFMETGRMMVTELSSFARAWGSKPPRNP